MTGRVDHGPSGADDRKRFVVDLVILEQAGRGGLGPVKHRGDQLGTQRAGKGELEQGKIGGHPARLSGRAPSQTNAKARAITGASPWTAAARTNRGLVASSTAAAPSMLAQAKTA